MEPTEEEFSEGEEDELCKAWLALMNPCIQSISTDSVEEVAQKVNKLTEQTYRQRGDDDDLDSIIERFWYIVYDRVVSMLFDDPAQERLCEIILALRALPPKEVNDGNTTVNIWEGVGYRARGVWETVDIHKEQVTEEHPDEVAPQYESLNVFFARTMTPESKLEIGFFGFMLQSFEEPSPMISAVRAAALWIKTAGQELYRRLAIKDYILTDRVFSPAPVGEDEQENGQENVYRGKSGWCRDRWDFWKERFRSIGGNYDGPTRQLVLEAIHRMEELEKQG